MLLVGIVIWGQGGDMCCFRAVAMGHARCMVMYASQLQHAEHALSSEPCMMSHKLDTVRFPAIAVVRSI